MPLVPEARPEIRPEARLAQTLIQSASPSGRESAVAAVYARALADLGFATEQDDAGNVIGRLRCGPGPTVLYNGHLDTVPPGDPDRWPHPPLGGVATGGELWGRGAVDMKGALASMAYGAADAAGAGFRGTLIVTAVVQEEVSGLGARYLIEGLAGRTRPDLVVLGEPSGLALMLGHRGRVELELSFPGRSAHAAKPELGDNPLYRAARFLERLEGLELPSGGPLGSSSVTPTLLETEPRDARNVVPGRATLVLDYRTVPGDEPEALCARLHALAPDAEFRIPSGEARSENGRVRFDLPRSVPAYLAPGENARVAQARRSLRGSLAPFGQDLLERVWWFATDAPYLAALGAPVIGFGPGDEELAHTSFERVPLRALEVARAAYRDLALGCADQTANREICRDMQRWSLQHESSGTKEGSSMKGEQLLINGDRWTVVDVAPAAELAEMVAVILEEEGFAVYTRGASTFSSDVLSHLGMNTPGATLVLVPEVDAERALALIAETVTDYEGEDLEDLDALLADLALESGSAEGSDSSDLDPNSVDPNDEA